MRYSNLTVIIIMCLCGIGCQPSKPDIAELPDSEPRHETLHFKLLSGPWSKYLTSPPEIYILEKTPSGINTLLTTEQKLIQAVLEAGVEVTETSAHSALNDRLDELKAAAPAAETSSGYVRSSSRKTYSKTYISGDTIQTNSSPYYYGYSVFREKQKSSSPDLVRSVSGIAANASLTLEDLDQRITAFQHLTSSWTRRTSTMSPNGTAGIMRDANEHYLQGLKSYTKDFIQLRKELRIIKNEQALKAANKSKTLESWKQYETKNLGILNSFFNNNRTATIQPTAASSYLIRDDQLRGTLILVCNIGPRQLYFELNGRNPLHPFTLADITPTQLASPL